MRVWVRFWVRFWVRVYIRFGLVWGWSGFGLGLCSGWLLKTVRCSTQGFIFRYSAKVQVYYSTTTPRKGRPRARARTFCQLKVPRPCIMP